MFCLQDGFAENVEISGTATGFTWNYWAQRVPKKVSGSEKSRAFVHWKFRRRITAIVYGGSFRRHHVYLL